MGVYTSLLRPALFRLPAEAAHQVASTALRVPLPWPMVARTPADPRLETRFAGLALANPVGLAAGFDKNGFYLRGLAGLGFGFLVAGTVTAEPRVGNPHPRLARLPEQGALINAMGLPNRGAVEVSRRLARSRPPGPLLVSVSGETVDEVIRAADLLLPVADGVELNVSCPNVKWGRDRDNEAFLAGSLRRLRAATGKPISVKLPPYQPGPSRDAIMSLVAICREEGANAITASNTLPAHSKLMSVGRGGLSGRPLRDDTVRIVRDIFTATGGAIAISACGGIGGPEDALACIRAGATTVQLYTGLIYGGPAVVREIVEGLLRGLASEDRPLSALVGSAA